jgi:hypothetical protein
MIWLQAYEQVFRAAIYTGNGSPNREFLKGCYVHEMAQLCLPHAHTGDRLAREPLSETTTNGFHLW